VVGYTAAPVARGIASCIPPVLAMGSSGKAAMDNTWLSCVVCENGTGPGEPVCSWYLR